MQNQTSTILGPEDDPGETIASVLRLLNTHVFPFVMSREDRKAGYNTVLQKASALCPRACPVLLCWRIWRAHKTPTLSLDTILRSKITVSDRAELLSEMAARWRIYGQCNSAEHGLCRALLTEGFTDKSPAAYCWHVKDARLGGKRYTASSIVSGDATKAD